MPDAPPARATTRAARWLALGILVATGAARASDVPSLSGRVVDDASILEPAARDHLTAALEAHERATGVQIVVLTTPTLAGEPIEAFAARVFAAWKLGQKGKDNGVLVIVVPHDRKMRIEVGYGLEATLPDAVAGHIISEVMTPRFKAGDYDLGVSDGVNAIIAALEGRPAPRPAATSRFHAAELPWWQRLGISLFIFGIIGFFTLSGLMTPGGGGWFLYVFLIPFWGVFSAALYGIPVAGVVLGTYLVGFPILRARLPRTAWYRRMSKRLKSGAGGGRAGVAGGGDGSSGDSSSSDSGFSGGGGGSGGGGASGSW